MKTFYQTVFALFISMIGFTCLASTKQTLSGSQIDDQEIITSIEQWNPNDEASKKALADELYELIEANSAQLQARKAQAEELLSRRTDRYVTKALKAYQKGNQEKALNILLKFINSKDNLADFDSAYVERFIGNLYASKAEKSDEALHQAILYLTRSANRNALGLTEQHQNIYNLMRLNHMLENYSDSIYYAIHYLYFANSRESVLSNEGWSALLTILPDGKQ